MGSTANEIMMLIDTSKCIGCRSCQVACKQWHGLPAETDSGTASSGGTGFNTLEDTSKAWAINEWAGMLIRILDGTGVGEQRTIVSNTVNVLTVSGAAWTIDSTSKYSITTFFNGEYTNPPDMSGKTLTVVKFNESRGNADFSQFFQWSGGNGLGGQNDAEVQFLFLKDQCRHCYQPKCKRGCPDGVYTTTEGFVLFGQNCNDVSCKDRLRNKINPAYDPITNPNVPRYIPMTFADHCPYNIPKFNTLLDRYVKCDFCYDRFVKNGNGIAPNFNPNAFLKNKSSLGISNQHTTACEFACPAGAIVTGSNYEIIGYTGGDNTPIINPDDGMGNRDSYANRRLREILPTYPQANIYHGLWGRCHVIWLLIATPDRYGLPTEAEPKLGIPNATWY